MKSPIEHLQRSRARARELRDPCVDRCFLATVSSDGCPRVRTLVLRDVNDQLAIFCNLTSPKIEEIEGTGTVEFVLWLQSIETQIRTCARVTPIDHEIIAQQWHNKPELGKKLDHLYERYPQSGVIESREMLLRELAVDSLPDGVASTIGGYFLNPIAMEFLDLAAEDGVHRRIKYVKHGNTWELNELMP